MSTTRAPFISVKLLIEHQNDPWWTNSVDTLDVFDTEEAGDEEEATETARIRACGQPKAFVARRPRPLQPDPFSGLH
jgi:hypothetical protein